MKISINSKFLVGPYGGGMQFANYMRDFLVSKGMTVVNHLNDDNIDVILHVNPFPFLMRKASAYSFLEAYAYKLTHPKVSIILRINECDERKGTAYVNDLLRKTASHSDQVMLIASWLKYIVDGKVILNGADEKIFNTTGKRYWDGKEKLKIVTHHWSSNANKGHDVYKKLDDLLSRPEFADKFEFTYIGAYPKELQYKNTTLVPALSGMSLADKLKKHHVYITATRNEPGGMHHIEGALCGLPILYINSGALPEYCGGFGIEFNIDNLEQKLFNMRDEYAIWKTALEKYNNTASRMASEYYEFIISLKPLNSVLKKKPFLAMCFKVYNFIYNAWWIIKRKLGIL